MKRQSSSAPPLPAVTIHSKTTDAARWFAPAHPAISGDLTRENGVWYARIDGLWHLRGGAKKTARGAAVEALNEALADWQPRA